MARKDAVAATTLLLLAAVAAYEAAGLPFGTVRNPGPGFLPWWAGLTLGLLALALLGQALARRPAGGPGSERGLVLRVGGVLAGLGAYVFLLEPVGYPVCTFLLVLFMLRAVEPHPWPVALGLGAIASVGSYVVFAIWLKVPLPPGFLAR